MRPRFLPFFMSALALFFVSVTTAQACLGVSRTIYVNSFASHLGTGGSGGIGLRHKEVVLTFDDGPKASTTPRVLRALAAECTKATFFVVGHMSKANPKLLQRVARAGHTIGQHTHNHANLAGGSIARAQRNIDRGVAEVTKALGPYKSSSTKLFRYPYLARSNALDAMVRRRGLLPLSAGVMSQDWKSGSGAAMVNRVMSRLNRTQRGIILLHDIQAKTASHLPALLNRLKAGGYKVVHIRSGRASKSSVAVASYEPTKKKISKRKNKKKVVVASVSPRNTSKASTQKRRRLFFFSDRDGTKNTVVKKRKPRKTVSRIVVTKKDAKKRKSLFSRLRSDSKKKIGSKRTAKKKARKILAKRKVSKKSKRAFKLFGPSADANDPKYRIKRKLPGNLKRRKGESLKSHFYRVRAAKG